MAKKITIAVRRIFHEFAFPCAEQLLVAGKITQDQYNILKSFVMKKQTPPWELIKECYPSAVSKYLSYAKENGLDLGKAKTVLEFWRHHHDQSGDCAVRFCTVAEKSTTDNVVRVKTKVGNPQGQNSVVGEEKYIDVFNTYGFRLKTGERVWVHQRTIVNKE